MASAFCHSVLFHLLCREPQLPPKPISALPACSAALLAPPPCRVVQDVQCSWQKSWEGRGNRFNSPVHCAVNVCFHLTRKQQAWSPFCSGTSMLPYPWRFSVDITTHAQASCAPGGELQCFEMVHIASKSLEISAET